MYKDDLEISIELAHKVADAGGRAYYVGGYVRDSILEIWNSDIDIEVHRVPSSKLEEILDSITEYSKVGASFGVYKIIGSKIDVSIPRMERSIGPKHTDFDVEIDPFVGEEKAASRRDFTMNAMMQDILTGEIKDFFGGKDDLKNGIIRHVKDETFGKDPLRVFRAAQFAARFNFKIAGETVNIAEGINTKTLSPERVMMELKKALTRSEFPSIFFRCLREMGQLGYWFKEMENLIGVPQDHKWHPEGDAWNHTMEVIDEASALSEYASNRFWFVLSAAAHDLGKSISTEIIDGKAHSYDHESTGVAIADNMLRGLTNENKLINYVLNMVRLHMKPNHLIRTGAKPKSYMKMFDESASPEDLVLLSIADNAGRYDSEESQSALMDTVVRHGQLLYKMLSQYKDLMNRPYVMGRDLVSAGIAPGPDFREYLEYAHKLRLAGIPKEEALKHVLAMARKKRRKSEANKGID